MSTVLRPEVSARNKYWISKHRHYELKHFCLQYPMWQKAYKSMAGYFKSSFEEIAAVRADGNFSDPTAKTAEEKLFFKDRIDMVEKAAFEANPELSEYILRGVVENRSYEQMRARFGVPCCKGSYYEAYRRFFWLLDKARK